MKTKNKILLSVGVVCLVAVVAVVAIVAVFAASQQTFTSSITVKYTSTQVIGEASANWYLSDGEAKKMTKSGEAFDENNDKITFVAGGEANTDTLVPQTTDAKDGITITNEKLPYVIFEYILKNDGTKPFKAGLKSSGTPSNYEVYAYTTNTTAEGAKTKSWDKGTHSEDKKTIGGTEDTLFDSVEVPNGETHYFYVVLYIPNVGLDASVTFDFTWTLVGQEAAA